MLFIINLIDDIFINMKQQNPIKILKNIANKVSDKLHCDRYGSCVHFAEIFVDEVNKQYPELLNNFDVIEGYVNTKIGEGRPQEHTWIRLENDEIIDPTFLQFTKYDTKSSYSKRKSKIYSGQEYYEQGKEESWFSERRKQQPKTVFKESQYSTLLRRYASNLPIEEMVDFFLDFFPIEKYKTFESFYKKIKDGVTFRIKHDMLHKGTVSTTDYVNDETQEVSKVEEQVKEYIDNNLKDKIEGYYIKHSKKKNKK